MSEDRGVLPADPHISLIEPHHFMAYPGNAEKCYGCALGPDARPHTAYNPKINRHPPDLLRAGRCEHCGADPIDPIHWPLTHLEFVPEAQNKPTEEQ